MASSRPDAAATCRFWTAHRARRRSVVGQFGVATAEGVRVQPILFGKDVLERGVDQRGFGHRRFVWAATDGRVRLVLPAGRESTCPLGGFISAMTSGSRDSPAHVPNTRQRQGLDFVSPVIGRQVLRCAYLHLRWSTFAATRSASLNISLPRADGVIFDQGPLNASAAPSRRDRHRPRSPAGSWPTPRRGRDHAVDPLALDRIDVMAVDEVLIGLQGFSANFRPFHTTDTEPSRRRSGLVSRGGCLHGAEIAVRRRERLAFEGAVMTDQLAATLGDHRAAPGRAGGFVPSPAAPRRCG